MLSRAATLKKASKEEEHHSNDAKVNHYDGTPMNQQGEEEQEEKEPTLVGQLSELDQEASREDIVGFSEDFNVWQRDPEKERDKFLGFFVMAGQPIPRDIFHSIMSFIPAFPFYFMLRSVCSQWLYEVQEQLYGNVSHLNLVDDGRPKYYMRDNNQIVQFKPIGGTGKGYRMNSRLPYHRHSIFAFLGNVFCNVRHLKLGWCSLSNRKEFLSCVNILLPMLKQLETLDILGTKTEHRPFQSRNNSITLDTIRAIAISLPISTKNLNFIGLSLPSEALLKFFSLFSTKARYDMVIHDYTLSRSLQVDLMKVDIQSLTLNYVPYLDMSVSSINYLKEIFPHFEMSIIEPEIDEHTENDMELPIVSYIQYLNYMSRKEGIVLSHMNARMETLTDEMIETIVDIGVFEYSFFQHLLTLSGQVGNMFQLEPHFRLDPRFVLDNIGSFSKLLELLTDPNRMKYPELVLDINATFEWNIYMGTSTLLSVLISSCHSETMLSMIKSFIEKFKPKLAVDGVRNFLLAAFLGSSLLRKQLAQHLLSLKPDLISLGDSDGIIREDRKELPLIQLCLTKSGGNNDLEDIGYLVENGASLTILDKSGNNILHSAYLSMRIDIAKYLISKCPQDLLYARNNNNETPLQQIFVTQHNNYQYIHRFGQDVRLSFLRTVSKLDCFSQSQSLQNYPTSCGTLLHAAVVYPRILIVQWLLNNGFDANSLNEKGETPLFLVKHNDSQTLLQQFARHSLNESADLNDFIDECSAELIKSGAKVDIISNEGDTVVTSAIRNSNYQLVNYMMLNPSILSKPLSELLSPRMKYGFNALHLLFKFLSNLTDATSTMTKRKKIFTSGVYSVAKHCALLCLEHYPEMLYEKSGTSPESYLEDISGISPLQILLEASKGVQLLDDLSINMSDIANKPVFTSKDTDEVAPLPVMYLALEVAIDIPMFDKLMSHTHDVFLRDESQDSKPTLLHIAAQRDASLCQNIIKHWRKRCKTRTELSKLVSQPLENDTVGARKSRNAAILACEANMLDVFSVIWPDTSPFAEQFDNPVEVALANNFHDFALSAAVQHNIAPSKHQLHGIIRRCLSHQNLNADYERQFIPLMITTEEKQPKPSWLELMTQIPCTENGEHHDEPLISNSLTTLQLLVDEVGSHIFDWLVRYYNKDALLDHAVKAVDPKTGNTLLHLLAKYSRNKEVGNEWSSILRSIVSRFRRISDAQTVTAPKRSQRTKANLPSFEELKLEELSQFINIQNNRGRTCLHTVAVYSSRDILRDLLEFGADIEIKDWEGRTPMDLMTDETLIDITRQFIAHKKDAKKPSKRKRVVTTKESYDDDNEDNGRPSRRKQTRTRK